MKIYALSCLTLGAGILPLTGALASEPESGPTGSVSDTAAKPYVVFMRTDVNVEQASKMYPVKDVDGRAFVVAKDGQRVEVSMVGEPHKIGFDHVLTLARSTASLTNLQSKRAYTPGTDPRMVRMREVNLANSVIGDNASLAEGRYVSKVGYGFFGTNAGGNVPRGTTGPGGGSPGGGGGSSGGSSGSGSDPGSVPAAQPPPASGGSTYVDAFNIDPNPDPMRTGADRAFSNMIAAEDMMASNIGQASMARLQAEADMAKEMFDAVEVSFEFSSQVYLEKPYLVVVTHFHTPSDPPGENRQGVFAKALDAIGSRPAKIDVVHGGFPPGFELDDVQVHLYSDGREIPTEVAPKRVALSRDEAFEYLKIEYLSGHKNETLTASPAIGRPTKEEQLKLTPNQRKAVYYAKVSAEGVPLGTFLDEACTQPVDGLVSELAQNIRYYPAMERGKLVEGEARLKLMDLPL
ncbi:MAG TPA: hypothetical protein VG936_08155 [Lacunisphaera sp.]|nr:hypothetical protein [Lacunisphaera sp.]